MSAAFSFVRTLISIGLVLCLSLHLVSCGGGAGPATSVISDNNSRPSLSLTANFPTNVVEGELYDYTPSISYQSASIVFSIVNQPAWASFDAKSGRLYGTPRVEHIGTTTGIVVSVKDSAQSVTAPAFAITVVSKPSNLVSYFISPTGNDGNSGRSASAAWRTFKKAFDSSNGGMAAGDVLVLLDGRYSIENGTGILREVDDNGNALANSAAIPSGRSREMPTIIRAANPGKAVIEGNSSVEPLSIGRKTRKDRYITIKGMRFKGGGRLYNSQYVTVQDSSFTGPFSIGTNDHHEGNTHNLVQDVWIWTNNKRAIATNYRAHHNVWRRVLLRSEGCDAAGCEGAPKADPSIGITVYDSQDVSLQNVIVIDRLLRADAPYADFATAQHTDDARYALGRNEWLGSISINSQDAAMHFEADSVVADGSPVWTIKHFVAIGNREGGINLGNKPYNYDSAGKPSSLIENATLILNNAFDNRSVLRVNSEQTTVIARNVVAIGGTRTGFNMLGSRVQDSAGYNPNATQGNFDIAACIQNCLSLVSNPLGDASLLYPLRVETGSSLGNSLPNAGARIINRYGIDGSISDDVDFNALSNVPLWPWPNEDRIKQEMCVDAGITRGFCSTGKRRNGRPITLTSYVWESLGNEMPTTIYP